ncbi:hypothetical protein BKA69DRAFT_1127326 [Paraphysoderma sedebokerense]|nr:hypothetical protein BKA69DRAFT_1127326 [Paraphysoderma sedebokerense]
MSEEISATESPLLPPFKGSEMVTEHIPEKFGRLNKYFQELTFYDMGRLTPDFIVESAEPQDKIAMKLLSDGFLLPYLDKPDPFDRNVAEKLYPGVFQSPPASPQIWRPEILSSVYSGLDFEKPTIDKLTVPDTKADVTTHLVLSGRNLTDRDIPFVLKLVNNLPKCSVVDLSSNRLSPAIGSDESFKGLLRIVNYVDVTINPVATIAGIECLSRLSDDLLCKVIWVQQYHLTTSVELQNLMETLKMGSVLQVHKEYYGLS